MPQSLLRVVDIVVGDGSVCRHSVIPEGDGAFLPPHPNLEVLAICDVLFGCKLHISRGHSVISKDSFEGKGKKWGKGNY